MKGCVLSFLTSKKKNRCQRHRFILCTRLGKNEQHHFHKAEQDKQNRTCIQGNGLEASATGDGAGLYGFEQPLPIDAEDDGTANGTYGGDIPRRDGDEVFQRMLFHQLHQCFLCEAGIQEVDARQLHDDGGEDTAEEVENGVDGNTVPNIPSIEVDISQQDA